MLITVFEIAVVVLIALGFLWEHKLVDFEDKLFAKIGRMVKKSRAKNRAKARALTLENGRYTMDIPA